jgi:hypothetical protein
MSCIEASAMSPYVALACLLGNGCNNGTAALQVYKMAHSLPGTAL